MLRYKVLQGSSVWDSTLNKGDEAIIEYALSPVPFVTFKDARKYLKIRANQEGMQISGFGLGLRADSERVSYDEETYIETIVRDWLRIEYEPA